MPQVSVIIPAYNAERFIGQCLESVLNQTLHDIEILAVDDGSTDKTAEIIESYAAEDSRLTLLRQQNQYAGVARNNGMAHAHGEYLYFLDADDYIEPTCLEKMVAAAQQSVADIVVVRATSYDNQTGATTPMDWAVKDIPFGEPFGQDIISKTLFNSFVGWPWDKLFRAGFIKTTGLTYQNFRTTNDAYFVFMAMALAKTMYCIDEHLVFHRVNNKDSLENTRGKSWHCAIEAAKDIKDKLVAEGLFDVCKFSYEGWISEFFCSTMIDLGEDYSDDFWGAIEEPVSELPCEREDYRYERDYFFARSARLSRAQLMMLSNKFKRTSDWQHDELDRAWHIVAEKDAVIADRDAVVAERDGVILELNQRLDDAEKHCQELESRIAELEQEVTDVRASASYKVGNTLIKPASIIKRALKK